MSLRSILFAAWLTCGLAWTVSAAPDDGRERKQQDGDEGSRRNRSSANYQREQQAKQHQPQHKEQQRQHQEIRQSQEQIRAQRQRQQA